MADTLHDTPIPVTLVDRLTGEVAVERRYTLWDWTNGNCTGCDCNRIHAFGLPLTDNGGVCVGPRRFQAIAFTPAEERDRRFFSLEEINVGYPKFSAGEPSWIDRGLFLADAKWRRFFGEAMVSGQQSTVRHLTEGGKLAEVILAGGRARTRVCVLRHEAGIYFSLCRVAQKVVSLIPFADREQAFDGTILDFHHQATLGFQLRRLMQPEPALFAPHAAEVAVASWQAPLPVDLSALADALEEAGSSPDPVRRLRSGAVWVLREVASLNLAKKLEV